ncbi:MAG: deoxyribodipyrimidine photo-lyase [Verrucomicrobiales bacterium]|nr:deoxyribodipyrimidine photo-lyase [Verrucomicrobiales bacterium]
MSQPSHRLAIHWFRRDLRLSDNTALWHASTASQAVLPVYVVSDWQGAHHWTGPGRQHFLCGCLESLSRNLSTLDSRLVIRQGDPVAALEMLIRESRADAVYFNRDPDPHGRATEERVRRLCRSLGIAVHDYKDAVLHEPGEVLTGAGDPYRVYTPYSRAWFTQAKAGILGRPKQLGTAPEVASDPLPTLDHWRLSLPGDLTLPPAGERAAHDRLKAALAGPVLRYAEQRNDPAADATSHLGPDLRYGTISVREVFHRAQQALDGSRTAAERESIHTFQKQLAWREFFMAVLGHFPHVLDADFNQQWRHLEWEDPARSDAFDRWREGRTGFPIVDAGMRQLLATGYMHNRVRMIVAMFLTKDLHLHWRLGEAHFMRHLLDGEIANNNGGWQWSAGTGADAAPYFRIQNPWTQSQRHDPTGTYVKRWVPELARCPATAFFSPPAGTRPIAADYPLPMVDHGEERERTLERFARAKEAAAAS